MLGQRRASLLWIWRAISFASTTAHNLKPQGRPAARAGPAAIAGLIQENSGSGNADDADKYYDRDERDASDEDRDDRSDRCDNSGSGSSGSGSGKDGDSDNLAFSVGYGNDAADYYDDDHEFDADEPVTDMFDALQFANALSDNGNGEVIVFEASNLVVIRDFETL